MLEFKVTLHINMFFYLEAEHQVVQLEEVFQVGLQGDRAHFYRTAPEEEEDVLSIRCTTETEVNSIITSIIQTTYCHHVATLQVI